MRRCEDAEMQEQTEDGHDEGKSQEGTLQRSHEDGDGDGDGRWRWKMEEKLVIDGGWMMKLEMDDEDERSDARKKMKDGRRRWKVGRV